MAATDLAAGFPLTAARIYVAGHRGLVGSAVCRALQRAGATRVITRPRAELDLADRQAVNHFFEAERPEHVVLAAARVGGIAANDTYPADFIRENLEIQVNVIDAAWRSGVRRLLFLGSSCVYPKLCPQPIREEYLLTGPLEPTNEAYAIAKIAGICMCQAYHRQYGFDALSLMPTNLYGPGDNFDRQNSHVMAALIRRFYEAAECGAAEVVLWGTGTPRREFLHVDDLADACLFALGLSTDRVRAVAPDGLLNVGAGKDMTIRELAELVAEISGFRGAIRFDPSRPDGTPAKRLDVSRMAQLGWKAATALRSGVIATFAVFSGDSSVAVCQSVSDQANRMPAASIDG